MKMNIEEIFEILGVAEADDNTKNRIAANITTTVEGRATGIIDDLLSVDQSNEFAKIVKDSENDPKPAIQWLQNNVPEAAALYVAVLEDYVGELQGQLS
jgi:hypothetical protein